MHLSLSHPFGRSARRQLLVASVIGPLLVIGQLTLSNAAGAIEMPHQTPDAPNAPQSVTATQAGPSADITVSWVPSTSGPAAEGASVELEDLVGGSYNVVSQITCGGSCTSTVFRNLNFGTTYLGLVTPWDVAGTGPSTVSNQVTPTTTCATDACVTLDATSSIGPANHADSGILDSVFNVGNVVRDMASLDTTMYVGSPAYNTNGTLNWNDWNLAVGDGTKTQLLLSNLWSAANGGNPPTPWSDWATYNGWVQATVTTIVASGEQVDYWDPYNEPGGTGYYDADNFATVTPALLLQQFLVTYQDIKAADPSAAIVGPSLADWQDYPNQDGTSSNPDPTFDMATFLQFAAANNLQLAAISWHEIADTAGPNAEENSLFPAIIIDHVDEARRLIASLPALGNPQIFINEFGLPEVQQIPGWDVGYLSALTTAGVNSASRACWPTTQCANPTLDSLLANNGVYTEPDYWVRNTYAAMSGNMIANSSNDDWVTALGSYDSTDQTITGLVGRGEGCTQDALCDAAWPDDNPLPAISATLTVTVPWTSGTVNVGLADIAGQDITPIYEPTPVQSTVPISPAGPASGTVTIPIPSFADGDAYSLTITPTTAATAAAPVITTQPASAEFYGSTGAMHLNKPIVGMAATPDGKGYWLVASDGGIFNFGDAGFFGSTGAKTLSAPIVGIAGTPDGKGYWLVSKDGGVFNFGDAAFYGSMGGSPLHAPIVGITATPDGRGYWLAASDGGVFNFGDAAFYGSTGSIHLNQPIVGITATPDGRGYWLAASDGGVFNFGDASFYGSTGSIHLNQPIVGITATPDGRGYWLAASDGGVFNFGDASFYGSTGAMDLHDPIVGLAAAPAGYWLVGSDGGIFSLPTS